MDSSPVPDASGRPLRILIALETAGGGSGRHVLDLASGLCSAGHAVVVAYSPIRGESGFLSQLEMTGARLVAVTMRREPAPLADLRALLALHRVVRQHGPFDVLHGHSSKAGALLRMLPAGGAAKIYTPHAFRTMDPTLRPWPQRFYRRIEVGLGRWFSDRIIAVGRAEYDHALEMGIPARKLSLVVNGIDSRATTSRAALRQTLNLPADAFVVGFVGRLTAQKAPERLVAALATLIPQNPKVFGLIVGNGDLKAKVERDIQHLGLAPRIRMVSDGIGQEHMPAMDVLALPSRYEAMPYVLLEALAEGLPVIAPPVGGTGETILHDVNGLVCADAASGPGLARLIEPLIDTPERLEGMRVAARERAQQFTRQHMVDQTVQVYRAVLRPSRRSLHHSAESVPPAAFQRLELRAVERQEARP